MGKNNGKNWRFMQFSYSQFKTYHCHTLPVSELFLNVIELLDYKNPCAELLPLPFHRSELPVSKWDIDASSDIISYDSIKMGFYECRRIFPAYNNAWFFIKLPDRKKQPKRTNQIARFRQTGKQCAI